MIQPSHSHYRLRFGNRQWAEKQTAKNTEDSGSSANAYGQSDIRRERTARIEPPNSEGISDISRDRDANGFYERPQTAFLLL